MEKLKELQTKRLELANEIKALADTQAEWKAEDQAKWETLNSAYDLNQAEIEAVNSAAEREAAIKERLEKIQADSKKLNTSRTLGRDNGQLGEPTNDTPREGDFGLAMRAWMQSPREEITPEAMAAARRVGLNIRKETELNIRLPVVQNWQRHVVNTLSGQQGNAGGFLSGETFIGRLERAMLAFGGILQAAEVIRTADSNPMRWPTANDTTNTGRQLGESQANSTLTDPTFAQVIWYAYKFGSDEIKVPYELLRDNQVGLEGIIGDMLGERLGRIQASKYTTGTGQATPRGIVTASALGVTAASATAIAFDELIDLEHSIDPSRRTNCSYMFHDGILKALRKLKDGNGMYLWQAGANSGAPDTLNRYPYVINQSMQSSVASATKTVLFGQLNQYKVRQVGGIRLYRLVERYREEDQDAFLAFVEGDGNLLDAGDSPVKHLLQAT